MASRRHELRRYPWQMRDSGQLLLIAAAGVWLVAAVAQTAAEGLRDPRIAIAFGALIAFGEVLRLNLPGDRETAPIGFAGALAYEAVAYGTGLDPTISFITATEFARHPVEDIEITIPVRMQNHLAWLSVKFAIHENRRLGGIPIVRVMRRRLERPGELTCLNMKRND